MYRKDATSGIRIDIIYHIRVEFIYKFYEILRSNAGPITFGVYYRFLRLIFSEVLNEQFVKLYTNKIELYFLFGFHMVIHLIANVFL